MPKVITKKHLARLDRERRQRQLIVISTIAIVIIVVGVIGFGYLYNNVIIEKQPVAKVDNTSISTRDWQVQVRYQRYALIRQYTQAYQFYVAMGIDPTTQSNLSQMVSELNDANTLGGQVLDEMINDIIIRDQAGKLGITVTPQEVDQAIQNNFGYFPNGTPTPTITPTPWSSPTPNPTELFIFGPTLTPTISKTTGSKTATVTPGLTPTLSSKPASTPTNTPSPTATIGPTSTPYTQASYQANVQKFLTSLETQGVTGFTEADLRKLITAQLYRQKVQASVTSNVSQIQEQVWIRHIVVVQNAVAQTVQTDLKAGQPWNKIAAKASIDTATKNNGGDMGWFPKGALDPAVEKVAFSIKVGDFSDPIQNQSGGWEVIQVIARENRPVDQSTYQQLITTAFQTWLTSMRSKYTITKYDYWSQRVPAEPTLNPSNLVPPGG